MATKGNPNRVSEDEEAEREMKIERDDPKLLQETRDFDEYKDDHRRGWGNRMNRSWRGQEDAVLHESFWDLFSLESI